MPKYSREVHRLAIEAKQRLKEELPAMRKAARERRELAEKVVFEHEAIYREKAAAIKNEQEVLQTTSVLEMSADGQVVSTADHYIASLIALQQKEIDRARSSFAVWGDFDTRINELGMEEEIGVRRDNSAEILAHVAALNTAINELYGLQQQDVPNVRAACAEILAKVPQVFEYERAVA